MRVLHIGKFYPPFAGGMENFLGDLLPALDKAGVQAGALVHDHTGGDSGGSVPGRNLWRVPSAGQLLYTPLSPRFPFWLRRVINQFEPDLLHLHLPNPSAFWVMLSATARRLPWLIHWHADVVESTIDRRLALAYRFYRPFEQKLLALSKAVIVTSPPYLASSRPLSPWRAKCRIVPLGLNPDRLPRPAPHLTAWADEMWGDAGCRILAVGRLTYYKGHEFLIKAVADLPAAKVLIAGTGERGDLLGKLIEAKGIQERVKLPGRLPEAELHALLNSCDCLCLPSVERTEAFGLVLLEAMRFGKPMVAADIPGSGVGWVIEAGKTGLLVPPADARQLAAALREMAADPERRARLGQAAAARFNQLFHIDGIARKIIDIYERILTVETGL